MPRISVYVDASDVFDDIDDDELKAEMDRREARKAPVNCPSTTDEMLLEKIWLHFRTQSNVPECLREYVYRKMGKVIA